MSMVVVNIVYSTFALVSYPTPSQKKLCDAYEFLNEKSGIAKREKNYIL